MYNYFTPPGEYCDASHINHLKKKLKPNKSGQHITPSRTKPLINILTFRK